MIQARKTRVQLSSCVLAEAIPWPHGAGIARFTRHATLRYATLVKLHHTVRNMVTIMSNG